MAAVSFSFFFKHILNKPYKIPSVLFAAHSDKLPSVMEVQEVFDVIAAIQNVKHKTIIILLYSTGMHVSEIANLKLIDIDRNLMRIKVVNGKGKKDRFVPLSPSVLDALRDYYKLYHPINYLFNGSGLTNKYSVRSIQHLLHKALLKIGIGNKNYTVHSIRHSFATHLVDNGADLQVIQELMGHSSLSQTTQYLHLSSRRINQTINPYDAMMSQIKNTQNKSS